MSDFLNAFVKSLIIARANEKKLTRAEKVIKSLPERFPERIPVPVKKPLPYPRIPPPRPLRMMIEGQPVPVPSMPERFPFPTVPKPQKEMALISTQEITAPKATEEFFEEPSLDHTKGYIKVELPTPEEEFLAQKKAEEKKKGKRAMTIPKTKLIPQVSEISKVPAMRRAPAPQAFQGQPRMPAVERKPVLATKPIEREEPQEIAKRLVPESPEEFIPYPSEMDVPLPAEIEIPYPEKIEPYAEYEVPVPPIPEGRLRRVSARPEERRTEKKIFEFRRPFYSRPGITTMDYIRKPVYEEERAERPIKLARDFTSEGEGVSADLGEINELLKDPYVVSLEYNNRKLRVKTAEGLREPINLSENEAIRIVENFAEAAGVEVKPSFSAKFGNLKMSAVISDILGIKFIIKKV